MSETEQQFLDARQAFRDHLRGHNKSIADAFTEIALASEQQSQHRVNLDNPHGMTKADIGLGLVENRPPATEQDIIDLVNLGHMMTPATLKQLIRPPHDGGRVTEFSADAQKPQPCLRCGRHQHAVGHFGGRCVSKHVLTQHRR